MSADTLRLLTVRQPWAWAIIHGGKDIENRVRSLGPYRGPVAIHAGVGDYVKGTEAGRRAAEAHGSETPTAMHFGAVIGVVDLMGTHVGGRGGCYPSPSDPTRLAWCSPWAMPDHHHLELANPRPLAAPIPATGRLGLWRPDDDLAAAILAALPKETNR